MSTHKIERLSLNSLLYFDESGREIYMEISISHVLTTHKLAVEVAFNQLYIVTEQQ